MSLLTSAALWTNDDTDNTSNKKRVPTMSRSKTVKKLPPSGSNSATTDEQNEIPSDLQQGPVQSSMQSYGSLSSVYTPQATMSSEMSTMEQRNTRVSQLVDKLTLDNAGKQLSDFQPLSHPIIQKKTDVSQGRGADEVFTLPQNNPLQIPPPPLNQPSSNFTAMSPDLGGNVIENPYGNYKNVYDLKAVMPNRMQTSGGVSSLDNRLLEKINYMVHLLEQQHNERTSNITEEFVLYTFLGVFIIFIVDTFSRSGRYVR